VTLIHPYNAIKNAAEKYSVNDSYEFNITYPEFYIKESWSTHYNKITDASYSSKVDYSIKYTYNISGVIDKNSFVYYQKGDCYEGNRLYCYYDDYIAKIDGALLKFNYNNWSKKWYNTPYYVNPFENCFFEKVNKFFGTYIDDCNSFYIGTDSTMSGESRKFKIILSSKVLQNFLDIMGFQSIENDPTNKKGLTNENWQNKLEVYVWIGNDGYIVKMETNLKDLYDELYKDYYFNSMPLYLEFSNINNVNLSLLEGALTAEFK